MNRIPRDLRHKFDNKSAEINPRFKESLRLKLIKEGPMATNPQQSSTFTRALRYVRSTPFIAVFAALLIVATSSALVATNRTNVARDAEVAVPANLDDLLSVNEIRAIAAKDANGSAIKGVELEQEDGRTVYKVKFSDGSVRIYDARTGAAITKASETKRDESVPASFTTGIGIAQARQIALEQRGGTIVKIELESEEGVVVYSVRFSDGGRVDVNASNGNIVRVRNADSNRTSGSSSSSSGTRSDDRSGSNSGSGSRNSGSDDSGKDDSGDTPDDSDGRGDRSGKSSDD